MNTKKTITKQKKERSDKLRNRAKVIKATLKDPLKSQRQIAREQGVSNKTVSRIQNEMTQTVTKDGRILGICDKDLEIITLGQEIIAEKLRDKKYVKKLRPGEISTALAESTRRYTLLKGDVTDEEGGLKEVLINVSLDE